MFEFKIYDCHETQEFTSDGEYITKPFEYWFKFDLAIDINEITAYREYVLFDEKKTPTLCTKVYLADGSHVYAVNKFDTFSKNYNEYIKINSIENQ